MTVPPLQWMRALRDSPDVGGTHLAVLLSLALRMRRDGTGWAGQEQLADDVLVSDRTVRRVLVWAQGAGYLVRTRRGHRVDDDTFLASEYRLTLPTQPDTDGRLEGKEFSRQPDTDGRLGSNGQAGASPNPTGQQKTQPDNRATQPDMGVLPRGLSSRGLPSSVPPFGGTTLATRGVVVEHLEGLEDLHFETAAHLGVAAARAVSAGASFDPDLFLDLIRSHFGTDGESGAFGAFHANHCKKNGCACHGYYDEEDIPF